MTSESYGALLKAARERAGMNTIRQFSDYLSQEGYPISEKTLGNYERDVRQPNREKMLEMAEKLMNKRGIRSLVDVNAMLQALGMTHVTDDEAIQLFPNLKQVHHDLPLPPRPYHTLIGRDALIQTIVKELSTLDSQQPILVISGIGGIGKTALAYEVVTQLNQHNVYEKMGWVSVKSETFLGREIVPKTNETIQLSYVLRQYAQQLGFDDLEHESDAGLYQKMRVRLQAGHYLLVLDNLESFDAVSKIAEQLHQMIRPSRQANATRIILTSRERLQELSYVRDYFLRGLTESASHMLIQDEFKNRNTDSALPPPSDVLAYRIHGVTGGMPLALKLIITQYLQGIPIQEELERLANVTDEQELYRFIYLRIWQKLSLPAQQILTASGAFGTSALRSMLVEVSDLELQTFVDTVPELVRASLLEVMHSVDPTKQRYDIHAMTRWFVNSVLAEIWRNQQSQNNG